MSADVLATQGVRASGAMVLTNFTRHILVAAQKVQIGKFLLFIIYIISVRFAYIYTLGMSRYTCKLFCCELFCCKLVFIW